MAAKRNASRPSMIQVAKLAGVSYQTVSRVINHAPDVAPATRAKVQAVIDDIGYVPSNSARALASQRSRTIGLIAGGRHFYGPVTTMLAIEQVARSYGFYISVMLQDANASEEEFAKMCRWLVEQNVDAFMFITPTDVMYEAAIRTPLRQPKVIITSTHGSLGVEQSLRLLSSDERRRVSLVGNDQWGAIGELAALVARYGHRNVLYFSGPRQWRDARTRLEAWNHGCAAASISSVTVQCKTWESAEAYRKMNHVLENMGHRGMKPPTCIVCANDNMAVGVIRALQEHGVRIPQEVSVTGFDDMPAMGDMTPPLTTIRPQFKQLGIAAMREALFLMGEGPENAFSISRHGVGLLPMDVIQRRSLSNAAH